jgi:hypothetical protein
MTTRETNITLRAPARLKLTLEEEKQAVLLIMEALLCQDPKPDNFKEWT